MKKTLALIPAYQVFSGFRTGGVDARRDLPIWSKNSSVLRYQHFNDWSGYFRTS